MNYQLVHLIKNKCETIFQQRKQKKFLFRCFNHHLHHKKIVKY